MRMRTDRLDVICGRYIDRWGESGRRRRCWMRVASGFEGLLFAAFEVVLSGHL